jgi:hypothetical protein
MTITTTVLLLFLHTRGDGLHPPQVDIFKFNFLSQATCVEKALEIERAWAHSAKTSVSWDCLSEEELDLE